LADIAFEEEINCKQSSEIEPFTLTTSKPTEDEDLPPHHITSIPGIRIRCDPEYCSLLKLSPNTFSSV